MTRPARPPLPEPQSPLIAQVQRTLGDSANVRARFSPFPVRWGPLVVSLGFLALYCLVWLGVEALTHYGGWQSQPRLVSLLAWGGLYFTAAYYFLQSAAVRLLDTIKRDIEPHASSPYLKLVTRDLARRHRPLVSVGLPLGVAAASLLAAVFAIYIDVKLGGAKTSLLTSPEFLFFCASYFLYFFTAAQAVVGARFYLSFADYLGMETKSFYVLGAAESPLVVGLSRLSGQVLIFWLMLFLTIVSSMILAIPWFGDYAFSPRSWFLLILVPVAGFFSLGFGSLVYLGSEAKIRATLRRFTQEKLAPIRRRSNNLFRDWAAESLEQRKVMAELADLNDRVVAGGKYGSRIGTTLSLVLPIALPILSIVKLVVG
jgi:hypothetical protein